jgi:hypothetical protein
VSRITYTSGEYRGVRGTIGVSTRASPGCKDRGANIEPTHRDAEITPERMPSILDKKAGSRSGATVGGRTWSAGGEMNGKQLTIIEHPESYEVRRRGASTFFYFEDEPASRNSTGRITRKQAEQAAKALVGPEQLKAKGK